MNQLSWLARTLFRGTPKPIVFLLVGTAGLALDVSIFSILLLLQLDPLLARMFSLTSATVLTWRLNRILTFPSSGRSAHTEAVRYAIVTCVSQGISYGTFAALILSVMRPFPQVALVIGSAIGAFFSYNGHRLFAFAPLRSAIKTHLEIPVGSTDR